MLAMVGAFVFMISDYILAFDKWQYRVKYGTEALMFFYYSAQLLISLSVVLYERKEQGEVKSNKQH